MILIILYGIIISKNQITQPCMKGMYYMKNRNFSMTEYWNRKASEHSPLLSFGQPGNTDWHSWHPNAKHQLFKLLGKLPQKVAQNAEVIYAVEEEELIRERVVFDTEKDMSIPCYVLRPKSMKCDKSNAAIICCNGHPAHLGKEPVAGVRSEQEHIDAITQMNYDYGYQMAKKGYLTIIPELRGFGERRDGIDPFPGRDNCNVNFIKGAILGIYILSLNIWDMMRVIDYLETREEVNPKRIGMMGLSYGGTMTAFTAALDSRIAAADIMGYINPWAEFAIKHGNFCGVQLIPEVYTYFETHDIAGLIAPRPLLLEMGIYDDCFFIQDQLESFKGVKHIYQAAGAGNQLWQEVHAGGHRFAGKKAFEFFEKYL